MRWMIIAILCLIPFNQDSEWRLDKDKNGIKVFTREVEGFSVRQFKVASETKGKLDKILSLFKDIENYPSWMPDIEDASLLKKESQNAFIYHTEINTPFPVTNRDLVTRITFSFPKKNILRIDYEGLPDYIPDKVGLVRIETFKGHWLFETIEGSTKINNQFLSDPGGSIPNWVVNSFLASNPYNTVKSLKEQVE